MAHTRRAPNNAALSDAQTRSQFLTDRIVLRGASFEGKVSMCHARTSEMTSPHTEIAYSYLFPG